MSDVYGQLASEKKAEENSVCRMIVKEISDFGVNQRQLLFIMHLLALQLEDVEAMRSLVEHIREIDESLLLSSTVQSEVSNG